jgi:hypothetical protein
VLADPAPPSPRSSSPAQKFATFDLYISGALEVCGDQEEEERKFVVGSGLEEAGDGEM